MLEYIDILKNLLIHNLFHMNIKTTLSLSSIISGLALTSFILVAQAQSNFDEFILDENDIAPPTVVSAEAMSSTGLVVLFNEPIFLPEGDLNSYFTITEEFDPEMMIDVVEVKQDPVDASKLDLIIMPLTPDMHYLLTVSSDVTDLAGNPIVGGVTDSVSFVAGEMLPENEMPETNIPQLPEIPEVPAVPMPISEPPALPELPTVVADTEAPAEATGFMAKMREKMGEMMKEYIELSWNKSISPDLNNQKVYTSMDEGKTYGLGVPVGLNTQMYNVENPREGQKYVFKLTSIDESGNESAGITTVYQYLPQTGMGLSFILIGSTLGAASFVRRRRK